MRERLLELVGERVGVREAVLLRVRLLAAEADAAAARLEVDGVPVPVTDGTREGVRLGGREGLAVWLTTTMVRLAGREAEAEGGGVDEWLTSGDGLDVWLSDGDAETEVELEDVSELELLAVLVWVEAAVTVRVDSAVPAGVMAAVLDGVDVAGLDGEGVATLERVALELRVPVALALLKPVGLEVGAGAEAVAARVAAPVPERVADGVGGT